MRLTRAFVYCRKDWKKHKINCTKLPTGPIELPTITVPLEELEKEAARAEEALKSAYKEIQVRILSF